MAFDLDMIKKVYDHYSTRVAAARKATGKHLTLTEKILYAHLSKGDAHTAFGRGVDYVDFAPDRVAMQDATAQMALAAIYAGWPATGCRTFNRTLRPPDTG